MRFHSGMVSLNKLELNLCFLTLLPILVVIYDLITEIRKLTCHT